jgi:TolB-like protein
VIARNSSFTYKGKAVQMKQIAAGHPSTGRLRLPVN